MAFGLPRIGRTGTVAEQDYRPGTLPLYGNGLCLPRQLGTGPPDMDTTSGQRHKVRGSPALSVIEAMSRMK